MDVAEFSLFINKAKEKEREEQIQRQWTALLPHMVKENYIAFCDYYDRCTGANIDTRSTAEIMKEIEDAHRGLRPGKEVDMHGI